MSTPDARGAGLSDSSDAEDLFASPSRTSKQTKKAPSQPPDTTDARPTNRGNGASKYDTEQTRNALLQRELEGIRNINEVIEGVVSSLECAKGNMEVRISPLALLYRGHISNNSCRRSRGPLPRPLLS